MTTTSTGVRAVYSGTGSAGPFPLTDTGSNAILFALDSEIVVTRILSTGTGTILTINLDYILTGAGELTAGGVTLTDVLEIGQVLTIERVTAKTQLLDLAAAGTLSHTNLEGHFDKQVRIDQELFELQQRSPHLPSSYTGSVVPILPAPSASKYIGWDASGANLENKDAPPSGSGSGDIFGPSGATSDAYPKFDGNTGKLLKSGSITIPVTDIDIIGATSATVAADDTIAIYDTTAAANKRTTVQGVLDLVSASVATGKATIWVPASAMVSRATSGAAAGSTETATNQVMIRTLDFDAANQEFAQFAVRMPKSWNEGTFIFQAVWSHAATTTNFGVTWACEAMARGDTDAIDIAWGTAQQVADTGGATNTYYATTESSALTASGTPAENDQVIFQVKRVPADAGDTLTIDARLHGIVVIYTTNANTDN